jgi:hypothetical protein
MHETASSNLAQHHGDYDLHCSWPQVAHLMWLQVIYAMSSTVNGWRKKWLKIIF